MSRSVEESGPARRDRSAGGVLTPLGVSSTPAGLTRWTCDRSPIDEIRLASRPPDDSNSVHNSILSFWRADSSCDAQRLLQHHHHHHHHHHEQRQQQQEPSVGRATGRGEGASGRKAGDKSYESFVAKS
jgi:hypothetical protein